MNYASKKCPAPSEDVNSCRRHRNFCSGFENEKIFTKQIFDEANFEMERIYNLPASNLLDLQYLCGSHMAQKARNQLQAPRRTALPWRDPTSKRLCPDSPMRDLDQEPFVSSICERHEDNCEQNTAEIQPLEQSSEHNIVRQTTIVWQNILENSSSCKQRKLALEVARQTSNDMWHRYENKTNTLGKRTPKSRLKHHKSFIDTVAQNGTFQNFETPSSTRNHKEIKLAKILPETLTSNAQELERGTDTNLQELTSGVQTLFIDFEAPGARHGNKTILPSLQKVT